MDKPITSKEAERYWRRVEKRGDDECWPWLGAMNSHGYGTACIGGGYVQAHRVAYQLMVGEIPEGLQLDHLCRNRACQNPAHLEPVTCKENIRRGSLYRTHCSAGHVLTEENVRRTDNGTRVCLDCVAEKKAKGRKPRKARVPVVYCKRGHVLPTVGVVWGSKGVAVRVCEECRKVREGRRVTHKVCPGCGGRMARKSKTCLGCRGGKGLVL